MKPTSCMPGRTDGFCLCGNPLPRKKNGEISAARVWCEPKCADRVMDQHSWTGARHAALKRNRQADEGLHCERCLRGFGDWRDTPEVNHIIPLVGADRVWTCANHEDNLEVLCHSCHLIVTAEQREARALLRRVRGDDPQSLVGEALRLADQEGR